MTGKILSRALTLMLAALLVAACGQSNSTSTSTTATSTSSGPASSEPPASAEEEEEVRRMDQIIPPKIALTRAEDINSYELTDGVSVAEVITQTGVVRQVRLEKGAKTLRHNHPEEETLVVISGILNAMTVDGDHLLDPGDMISLESYAEHQLEAVEDTFIVQSFSAGRVIVQPQ